MPARERRRRRGCLYEKRIIEIRQPGKKRGLNGDVGAWSADDFGEVVGFLNLEMYVLKLNLEFFFSGTIFDKRRKKIEKIYKKYLTKTIIERKAKKKTFHFSF